LRWWRNRGGGGLSGRGLSGRGLCFELETFVLLGLGVRYLRSSVWWDVVEAVVILLLNSRFNVSLLRIADLLRRWLHYH
jgi:hypothetical protein